MLTDISYLDFPVPLSLDARMATIDSGEKTRHQAIFSEAAYACDDLFGRIPTEFVGGIYGDGPTAEFQLDGLTFRYRRIAYNEGSLIELKTKSYTWRTIKSLTDLGKWLNEDGVVEV